VVGGREQVVVGPALSPAAVRTALSVSGIGPAVIARIPDGVMAVRAGLVTASGYRPVGAGGGACGL
jgi:hypothetical protein